MNMTNERIQTKSKHTSPPGLLALVLMTVFIAAFPRPADAACSNPTGIKADIVYNSSQKLFEYCNDTNWVRMNPRAGSGTGGCTNPAMDEGKMVYNADHRVMQGCAGNVWRAMGVPNTGNWLQMSTSVSHVCGIKHDYSLWCWGEGGNGQLGNGSNSESPVPVLVSGGGTWKSISAGQWYSCGIRSDDTARCWGAGWTGALGTGAGGDVNVPTVLSGGGTWKSIDAGLGHTCGIRSDDTGRC